MDNIIKKKIYDAERYKKLSEEERKLKIEKILPVAKARYHNLSEEKKKEYIKRQSETRHIREAKKKANKKEVEILKEEVNVLYKENKALKKEIKALKKENKLK